MNVVFQTNIDVYGGGCKPFPNFSIPPRIGEKVQVLKMFHSFFQERRLPITLEVMNVTWVEDNTVICELHYSESDVIMANICNINLYP